MSRRDRVGAEGGPHGGGQAEAAHQRLGAVVARAHAHAELVEHLGDVVGVHAVDVEADDPAALGRVRRAR